MTSSPLRPIRTLTSTYLKAHRDTHAKHPEFGTHRHPYLHDTMRALVEEFVVAHQRPPSLLDYGCGKGAFLEKMRALDLLGEAVGYDPAVDRFSVRPDRRYDFVTCLDVLDQLAAGFEEAVIEDVAQLTGATALFSVITRQTAKLAHVKPRPATHWHQVIQRHLRVVSTQIKRATALEYAQGSAQERAVIIAAPRG